MSTKVKQIEVIKGTYEGKPTTSYKAHLEDGIVGFLDKKVGSEFKEGDVVEYTKLEKTSSKGAYFVLTLTKVGQTIPPTTPPTPAKEEKKPTTNTTIDAVLIFKERCENSRRAMQIVGGFVTGDKINLDKVNETFKEVNILLQEAIDDILSA
jgi:hypothetical protein